LLGITRNYLSLIENNHQKPAWDLLEKMGRVYGIPIPLVLFSSLTEVDLKKDKAEAFKMYKPIIDLIINQLY
jgi:transcriptional regulator with XRE-family HTH domain